MVTLSEVEGETPLLGIHHVTAIAGDPQRNLDFYTRVLGLRLVKLTVNFDDPTTYHFYYADRAGTPGTILTFFPWPNVKRGHRGTGQVTSLSFSVPPGSLGFWYKRLYGSGASLEESQKFGERVLVFTDPDNLLLELVESETEPDAMPVETSEIPLHCAIRALHSVAMTEADIEPSEHFLTDVLGFRLQERHHQRNRYRIGAGERGMLVDVVRGGNLAPGHVAGGTVHHVAFRTSDAAGQEEWRGKLARAGFAPTPVRDRQYFQSIYFLEPGTVLLEIATDTPGFATDETVEKLGTSLRLPAWLEQHRDRIEAALPKLNLPTVASSTTG